MKKSQDGAHNDDALRLRWTQSGSFPSLLLLRLSLCFVLCGSVEAFGGGHESNTGHRPSSPTSEHLVDTTLQPLVQTQNLFGICTENNNDNSKELRQNGSLFPVSENQLKSITVDAPAVLLNSGPGTGKTFALASRIVHLLETKACGPQHMVVMSFTNRDAEKLKSGALDMLLLAPNNSNNNNNKKDTDNKKGVSSSSSSKQSSVAASSRRRRLSDQLWSGTIHAFASNIVRIYGSKSNLRTVSSNTIKVRLDTCLRRLLDPNRYNKKNGPAQLKAARILHKNALAEANQSRQMTLHHVSRCIELWKESGLIPPPAVKGLPKKGKQKPNKDGCTELALRLGVQRSCAELAFQLLPLYQELHELSGTVDPADLASVAHDLLVMRPLKLSQLRSKLKHIIVDEYQDVSVTQHRLIRLVVRGLDADDSSNAKATSVPPVLTPDQRNKKQQASKKGVTSFSVPKLFCSGDSDQSIYGWRGAAPKLSVEGFRRDFPQGVVIPLETNFRIPSGTWKKLNTLRHREHDRVKTFPKSPVSMLRREAIVRATLNNHQDDDDARNLSSMIDLESNEDLIPLIYIQGMWDAREEAKHIATKIRRRSKERIDQMMAAQKSRNGNTTLVDPTEVAVLVRGANQIKLVREALRKAGVPYTACEETAAQPKSAKDRVNQVPMKPVTVMTIHRAKGEEFDDVYLPGWTEGAFPHPTAVSTNRVDEERRLAYVAISRACHHVEITHSFVRRSLHTGPQNKQKLVTEQVQASRFIYELVPDGAKSISGTVGDRSGKDDSSNVIWNRRRGAKGHMAGSNVPEPFKQSYQGFNAEAKLNEAIRELSSEMRLSEFEQKAATRDAETRARKNDAQQQDATKDNSAKAREPEEDTEYDEFVELIVDVINRRRGSQIQGKQRFRQLLTTKFDVKRGSAPLFRCEETLLSVEATPSYLQTIQLDITEGESKALSRCSALQLGLYLLYLFRMGQSANTQSVA